MALDPLRRYRGRYTEVTTPDGDKLYVVGCGKNLCDGTDYYHNARLVGESGGVPVYAIAAEGCELPLDPAEGLARLDTTCVTVADYHATAAIDPFMVEKATHPPYGVGRLMRATITSALGCGDLHCAGAWLKYYAPGEVAPASPCANDATLGVWRGCVTGPGGQFEIQVYYVPAAPVGLRWKMCVGGGTSPPDQCITGATEKILSMAGSCTLSMSGVFTSPLGAGTCCECSGGQINITVETFCASRRAARYVGKVGGVKVFAVGGCLDPYECAPSEDCCAVLATCDLTATVEVSDPCCADLAGTYELTYSGLSGSTYSWTSAISIPACSRNWTILVTCTAGVMTMSFFNTDVGATCSSTSDPVTLDPCWPAEAVFAPEFSCSFGNPSFPDQCVPSGVTVTVTS
jgi:hypothetical protein